MKKVYLMSLVLVGSAACSNVNAPEREPEVNQVADSTLLYSLEGLPVKESKELWTAIFNKNMGKYWKAKQDCNECVMPKSQYFLMSQTSLIAGYESYGDITL